MQSVIMFGSDNLFIFNNNSVCVICVGLVVAVRGERQEEERPQDGEEEQSGAAGEQVLLQGGFQNALVC